MNKEMKEFFRYGSLIISTTILGKYAEYLFRMDFAQQSAWIAVIFFGWVFYILSK